MGGGDLAEALSTIPFPEHRDPVDVDGPASDVAAFEPGSAHAGPDSFDDEVPLQLGDRADDDDDGAAERTAGIEVLAERDVLDVETVEFIQHLEEVADGSDAQTRTTWKRPRRASRSNSSRPGRLAFVPEIRSVYSATISEPCW